MKTQKKEMFEYHLECNAMTSHDFLKGVWCHQAIDKVVLLQKDDALHQLK